MEEEFLGEKEVVEEEFLGGTSESSVEKAPPVSLGEQLVNYYSTALGRTDEEVQADIDSGFYPMLKQEANAKANQMDVDSAQAIVNRILEMKPEDADVQLSELREGLTLGQHVAPDVAVILRDDTDFSTIERKVLEKAIAFERVLETKRAERSQATGSGFGYCGGR